MANMDENDLQWESRRNRDGEENGDRYGKVLQLILTDVATTYRKAQHMLQPFRSYALLPPGILLAMISSCFFVFSLASPSHPMPHLFLHSSIGCCLPFVPKIYALAQNLHFKWNSTNEKTMRQKCSCNKGRHIIVLKFN